MILQTVEELRRAMHPELQPQPQPQAQPPPPVCPVETNDEVKRLNGILTAPGAHLLDDTQLKTYKKIFPKIDEACGVEKKADNVSVMTVIGNFDECMLFQTFTANCARVAIHLQEKHPPESQHVLLLHIDSPGGIVTSLQRMLGALNLLRDSYPELIVATLCTGIAMSCGAVLFLQGQYRFVDTTTFRAAETGGRQQRMMLGSSILIHAPFGKKEYTKRGEMIELIEVDQLATAVVYGGIDNAQWKAAMAYDAYVKTLAPQKRFKFMAHDGAFGAARIFLSTPAAAGEKAFDTWSTRKYIIPRTNGMTDQLILSKDDIGAFMLRSHMDLVHGTSPPVEFFYNRAVYLDPGKEHQAELDRHAKSLKEREEALRREREHLDGTRGAATSAAGGEAPRE